MAQLINTLTQYNAAQYGRIGPFRSSGGNFYVVTSRESTPTNTIAVWKAPGGGPASGTWTEQDTSNRPTMSGAYVPYVIDVVQVSDVLHIAYGGYSSQTNVSWEYRYATYNMATDAYAIDEAIDDSGTSGNYSAETFTPLDFIRIGVRSDGDVVVVYQSGFEAVKGTDRNRVCYARRESGSWTTTVAVDDGGSTDYAQPQGVMGANDRFHITYFDGNPTSTSSGGYKHLASDNTLSSVTAFSGSGSDRLYVSNYGFPIGSNDCFIPQGAPDGGNFLGGFELDSAGGKTARDSASIGAFPFGNGDDWLGGAWDSDESLIRLVWRKDDTTDTRRHATLDPSGPTWSDVEELNSDESTTPITGYSVVYDSAATKLRYVYAQNADAYYEELDLGGTGTTYQGTCAESFTMADVVASILAAAGTASETLAQQDAALSLQDMNLSVADALTLQDSPSGVIAMLLSVAESVALQDTMVGGLLIAVSIAESVALQDSDSGLVVFAGTVTESMAQADTPGGLGALQATLIESGLTQDQVTSLLAYLTSIAESQTLQDAINAAATFDSTLAESIAVADTVSGIKSFLQSCDESVSVQDLVDTVVQFAVTAAESTAVQDVVSGLVTYLLSLSESVALQDAVNGGLAYLGSITEAVTLSDTVSGIRVLLSSIAEGLAIQDSVVALASVNALVSESMTMQDAVSGLGLLIGSLSESLTLQDTMNAGLAFVQTIGEGLVTQDAASALYALVGSIAEGAAVQDTMAAVLAALNVVSESVTMQDLVSGLVSGEELVTIAESAAVSDAATATLTFLCTIAETLTVADLISGVTFRTPVFLTALITIAAAVGATIASSPAVTAGPPETEPAVTTTITTNQ